MEDGTEEEKQKLMDKEEVPKANKPAKRDGTRYGRVHGLRGANAQPRLVSANRPETATPHVFFPAFVFSLRLLRDLCLLGRK